MNIMIKQLDSNTINKIAAGEVIESPKSIIKELVENSIDAGANEIIVEIKNGGKSYIRITDNGSGINKSQIEDAFKRHYTSKIDKADDLNALHTLGFRGEALASIAAVSKVEVITRTSNENYGTKFIIEGGKTISKEETGCPTGTTFIVKDLFYNIPARLKFLKSDVSEAAKINEIVLSLALGTKNISFKYISNGKTIFKTPKTVNMLNVLSSLYDRDLVNSLIEVNYNSDFMKISGYTSNLNYYRGNRKKQLFFVNGRFVKHNRANFFVEAAYNTLLPKDKHPVCFLCIDINTNMIDVNVHPAKTEIRVKEEEKFLKELKSSIYNALRDINLVKEVKSNLFTKKTSNNNDSKNISIDDIFNSNDNGIVNLNLLSKKTISTNINDLNSDINSNVNIEHKPIDTYKDCTDKNINDKINENISIDNNIKKDINLQSNKTNNNEHNFNDIFSNESLKEFDELYKVEGNNNKSISINDDVSTTSNNTCTIGENTSEIASGNINKTPIPNLKYIGILFKTYILCECVESSEFYMIDQHAAHERINYEKFLNQFENRNIVLQELLIPEVINLSYEDYHFAMNNKDMFENLGLPIDSFGVNDILINSVPLIFTDRNIKELFFNILDSLKDNKKSKNSDIELKKIIKNACVSSVKSGDSLHPAEINKLISDLSKTECPYTCPHGRPTIIKMTKYEIERMFERIQI